MITQRRRRTAASRARGSSAAGRRRSDARRAHTQSAAYQCARRHRFSPNGLRGRLAYPRRSPGASPPATAHSAYLHLRSRSMARECRTVSTTWDAWADLTRFLEGARIAFARERTLWESLELADRDQARVRVPVGKGWYTASLDQHTRAVSDEETLYASVLIHSYALAESAAADALSQPRVSGGIEGWVRTCSTSAGRRGARCREGKLGRSRGQPFATPSPMEQERSTPRTPGDCLALESLADQPAAS